MYNQYPHDPQSFGYIPGKCMFTRAYKIFEYVDLLHVERTCGADRDPAVDELDKERQRCSTRL